MTTEAINARVSVGSVVLTLLGTFLIGVGMFTASCTVTAVRAWGWTKVRGRWVAAAFMVGWTQVPRVRS